MVAHLNGASELFERKPWDANAIQAFYCEPETFDWRLSCTAW